MINSFLRNSRNLFILGALLAAIAFVMAFALLSRAQQSPAASATGAAPVIVQPTATPIPAPVLVATTDIPAMTTLDLTTAGQLFSEVPISDTNQYVTKDKKLHFVTPDYIQGLTGLHDLMRLGPIHVGIKLPKNTPLLIGDILTNTVPGLIDYSSMLDAGEIAELIQVQPNEAENGNIQPGDRVDLQLTYNMGVKKPGDLILFPGVNNKVDPNTATESQMLVQNLRVLSVSGINYVLAVSHQDGLLIKWVKDTSGTVDMVVRSPQDAGTQPGKKPVIFKTTAILPTYLLSKNVQNPFVMPTPVSLP